MRYRRKKVYDAVPVSAKSVEARLDVLEHRVHIIMTQVEKNLVTTKQTGPPVVK